MSTPEPRDEGATRKAYLFLTLTTLFWGGNAIFGKMAVGEVSPLLLVTLRWTSVMVLLFFVARRQFIKDWPLLKPRLGYTLAMGAIGFTGFNSLFYVAAHSTDAVNMGIIQGAMPVFVFLGGFFLFKTRVKPTQIVGVVVTLIGVIVVTSAGSLDNLLTLTINDGDALLLFATVLYAGYTLALHYRPNVSPLSFFVVLAVAAFVSSLPLAAYEFSVGATQLPTLKGWVLVIVIAVLPSFLAQLFYMTSVTLIGPGRAGIFINLVPIFAAIMAVVFLSEQFELYHGASLALVLAGIWLSERGKKA
jgi:drug/metabolite transporter (DMT)-like permease